MKKSLKKQAWFELGVIITLIILLNVIASFLFTRIDFTKEKRYTLVDASKELVKNLDDVVYVKVYLEGEFPAGFKRLRNSTRELLDEFRAYAGDMIQYEFINPSADPDPKVRNDIYRQLYTLGLQPTNLQVQSDEGATQKIIFPGALISYRNKQIPVQLLQSQAGLPPDEVLNNSVQALQYELANAIRKVQLDDKPKLGFIEGHGELDTLQLGDIRASLKESFDLMRIDLPHCVPEQLNDFKLLIVAKPTSTFDEKDKFKLDQYIMNGGRIIWLLDNVMADMDSMIDGNMLSTNRTLNLDDQLFKYGARVNYDLVQDLNCLPIPIITGKVDGKPQQQLLPWLYYPLFIPESDHPIVNNLDGIRSEFAGTIDTIKVDGIKKTPLIVTSAYTKVLNSPVRISLNLLGMEPDPRQFNKKNLTVALLLEGSFTSVFKNRLDPNTLRNVKFKEEGVPTKMIIISDGDIIKNYVAPKDTLIYPLGYDRFTNQTFANKVFIQNAIDYLTDDSGLITVRSRDVKLRMLDKTRVKAGKLKFQLINTLVPVGLILLFGVVYSRIRKRRYEA